MKFLKKAAGLLLLLAVFCLSLAGAAAIGLGAAWLFQLALNGLAYEPALHEAAALLAFALLFTVLARRPSK
jgi:hypothetical protein